MTNMLIVRIADSADHLIEDVSRFVFRKACLQSVHGFLSSNEILQEIAAFHELEDENHVVLRFRVLH